MRAELIQWNRDAQDDPTEPDDSYEHDEHDVYDECDEYDEAVELWLRTEGAAAVAAYRADPTHPRALERLRAPLDQWTASHLGDSSGWGLEVVAFADEAE